MHKPERILLVSDDAHLLRDVFRVLRDAGYEIIEARTGADGLRLAMEQPPDLILLDVILPDGDSIEICRKIKREPTTAGCFVMMTGGVSTASDDQAGGLEAGADGYIIRPISDRELLARVAAMLRIKRVEAELRERERILNTTGKIGRIGGWEHDLTTRKAVWTKALYDIIEFPYGQTLPGVNEHLDYYPPQEREILERTYDQAVETGVPFDLELQVYTASQKLIWCRIQGEPVYEDGECVAMRGIFQDITKRKQAELALRDSEERLRRVVEHMPVMMDAMDEDNNMIVWNRECERVTGYSAEEMIGNPHSIETLYPDDDYREQMLAEVEALGYDFRNEELILIAKDGKEKTVSWSNISAAFPIPGWHTWAVGVDVTERVRAEAELRQHHAHLEEVVAERTAELRNMVNLMAGREIRMAELKQVIRALREQLEDAGLEPVADDPLLGLGNSR